MAVSITLERDAVHQQLGRIANVAGKTSSVAPILGHALLEPGTNAIHVTASNMDVWLTVTLPAKAKKFAPIAIPADELHHVIAALPAGAQLTLGWADEDATFVTLKSGRCRFKLPVMAASDFPPVPARGDEVAEFPMAAGILNAVFARSKWAAAKEEQRYYLCGVFLHIENDRLVAAATNGHILARTDSPATEGAHEVNRFGQGGASGGIIVPLPSVKTIATLIGDTDADLYVFVGDKSLTVSREDEDLSWSFTTRLIDGTYPDYARLIPARDNLIEVDVQVQVFQAALARVALLATDAVSAIKLAGAKGLLRITTAGPDGREAEEEIDAAWKTQPIEGVVAFNAKYLKAVLDGVAAETVCIAFHPHPEGPSLLTPRERTDTLGLITPVRG